LKKKGKWYRVKDFEGDMGWIHATLVDKSSTVIVKVSRANIRTGPGTQHDLAFDAGKGTPFKVLESKERWLRVQHSDGDAGWIFKSLTW
jgi:SH3-like domain-containing protein